MDLKRKYFFKRNHSLLQDDGNKRKELGEREVRTLISLAKLYGYDISSLQQKTLIDLGAGDQHIKESVETQGVKYIGLDIDDLNFEIDHFPIEDNSIDIAISLAVLEHLNDPALFLKEIFRVLKPGGLIYLSTPNFRLCYKTFYNDYTHVKPYTPESIESLLNGFDFVNPYTYPGLRCKPNWFYEGKYRFFKAHKLLPFTGDQKFIPSFLKGKSTSIFALALKPPNVN
jgi:SAM-dependent methyltransferase